MKTFTVEIDGQPMDIQQDDDGAFIVPDGWRGIGSGLKPAYEPITLARKPLAEKSIGANVLAHGTGALNIDAGRVGLDGGTAGAGAGTGAGARVFGDGLNGPRGQPIPGLGRWPANVIHDGSEEVLAGFPETQSGTLSPDMNVVASSGWSGGSYANRVKSHFEQNAGSAARYFYTAKADKSDRLGSVHPMVKPVDLIAYLCRLITPPGGLILDPFAGSGTTGMACMREGFRAILIEREAQYVEDIKRRLAHVKGEDAPLFAAT